MNRSCRNHEVPVFMKLVCLLGCCADNHECSCIVILHVGSIRNQPSANNAHDLCCFCLLGEYFSLLMKRSFRKTNVSHSERRRVSPFSRFIASNFLALSNLSWWCCMQLVVNCGSFVFLLHVLYAIFLRRLGLRGSITVPGWVERAI